MLVRSDIVFFINAVNAPVVPRASFERRKSEAKAVTKQPSVPNVMRGNSVLKENARVGRSVGSRRKKSPVIGLHTVFGGETVRNAELMC